MAPLPHICHISLLNPAIHSRIFFKMALSQVRAGFRVTIIAQDPASAPYMREGVQIIPLGIFGRLSWRRIWSVRKLARLARRQAADIYQVHTVELLATAKRLKQVLPHAKIVYDMHEDYVANILHADYYSEWMRPKLAEKVRSAQEDFVKWGDGLILAETCFQRILPFEQERVAVVRNKFQPPQAALAPRLDLANPALPMMLYTGTIAENWGVLDAIMLWERLNQIAPINLVIAGHSQDAKLLAQIRGKIDASGHSGRFALVGGENYVPFEELVALIKGCTFGVALYKLKENIKDRIPTKFYEFMAQGKCLIFTANPAWERLNAETPFGLVLPQGSDSEALTPFWAELQGLGKELAHSPLPQSAWSWETEAPKMLDLMHKLIS